MLASRASCVASDGRQWLMLLRLTLILVARTDFATPPGQEDGISLAPCHLGTLRLDVLALDSAYDASLLVYLKLYTSDAFC